MVRRWKAKRCWDKSEISNCKKQLPSSGLGEPKGRGDVTRTQEYGEEALQAHAWTPTGDTARSVFGALVGTPATGAQTSERSTHKWSLMEHHVSDAWTAGCCYFQRVHIAWLPLVAYRPQLEAKNQSFLSPSQLPLFNIVSYWPVRSQQGVWKR